MISNSLDRALLLELRAEWNGLAQKLPTRGYAWKRIYIYAGSRVIQAIQHWLEDYEEEHQTRIYIPLHGEIYFRGCPVKLDSTLHPLDFIMGIA